MNGEQGRRWVSVSVGLLVAGVSALAVCAPAFAGAINGTYLVGMGTLPTGNYSYGLAISGDGRVAVGTAGVNTGGGYDPVGWTLATGCYDLGLPPGSIKGTAVAASSDGSVITGIGYTNQSGFRYTQAGGLVDLGPIDEVRYRMGISGDGNTIVARRGGVGSRWRAGIGWETLAGMSESTAITPDASVIVGIGGGVVRRWTEATGAVAVPTMAGGSNPYTMGVSADGGTIVGSLLVAGRTRAFRWTAGVGMQNLGTIPGASFTQYTALSANADGSVILGTATGGNSEAFIWTATTGMLRLKTWLGMQGLSTAGFTFLEGNGITPDGKTLVGFGGVDGELGGWVAHIPSPGAGGVLVMAGVAAVRRRRR